MLTPTVWAEVPVRTCKAALVRGGTSKCWLFHAQDTPTGTASLDRFLIDVMGARDPRQIDGVGGGTSTTSKVAIVRPSQREGISIEYLFGQVGIGEGKVEWLSDCGNCATAIAVFAVEQGMVEPAVGARGFAMLNTGTGSIFTCRVDADRESESCEIPGVVGTGTAVAIRFATTLEASSFKGVFPSGQTIDQIEVGERRIAATLITAGTPVALLWAEDLGLTGLERLERIRELQPLLSEARQVSAGHMGLETSFNRAHGLVKSIPKVGIVGRPADYVTEQGRFVNGESYDLTVRMLSMDDPHPAIGLTTAAVLGVASVMHGSLLQEVLSQRQAQATGSLRVGTPSGVLSLSVSEETVEQQRVVTVEIERSARTLAYANLVVRPSALDSSVAA